MKGHVVMVMVMAQGGGGGGAVHPGSHPPGEHVLCIPSLQSSIIPPPPAAQADRLPSACRPVLPAPPPPAPPPSPQAYLLLDASDSLQPLAADMGRALEASISSVAAAAVAASGATPSTSASGAAPHQQQQPQQPAQPATAASMASAVPFSPEMAAEAMSSAALCDVMLQLFPPHGAADLGAGGLALLAPALRAMAALLAHPGLPPAGLNVKVVNVMEAFLEVLGRLWIMAPLTLQQASRARGGAGRAGAGPCAVTPA